MKTLLITGTNGTLAPVVARLFAEHGWHIVPWDRSRVSPEDAGACQAFWQAAKPDAVCHLALGSEAWATWLADMTAAEQIPYLFTSTAMVFDGEINGPYDISSRRNARDDYGRYKIRCEDLIRQHNPAAMVVRIGWQIGSERGGNNMLEQLWQQMETNGKIAASTAWIPACSLMTDTARGLLELAKHPEPGLFHLDSNAQDRLSFAEIVRALKRLHGADGWRIEEHREYVHDQRLLDEHARIRDLSAWLPL